MKSLAEWFQSGQKLLMAVLFALMGGVLFCLTGGTGSKGFLAYMAVVVAFSCLWNIVLSLISKFNINIFAYVLSVAIPTYTGILLADLLEGTVRIGVLTGLVLIHIVVTALFMKIENIFKRIVLSMLSLIFNGLSGVAIFVLIAYVNMPKS